MNMLQTHTNLLHVAEKASEIRTFAFHRTAPGYFGHQVKFFGHPNCVTAFEYNATG
jgi:hypothetical protein